MKVGLSFSESKSAQEVVRQTGKRKKTGYLSNGDEEVAQEIDRSK